MQTTASRLHDEGREEGIQKGIQEGLEHAALKMLRRGMNIEEIAETLDLPLQKLQKLKA